MLKGSIKSHHHILHANYVIIVRNTKVRLSLVSPFSQREQNLRQQLQTLSCPPPWTVLSLGNYS